MASRRLLTCSSISLSLSGAAFIISIALLDSSRYAGRSSISARGANLSSRARNFSLRALLSALASERRLVRPV
nr:MAG TPA: hypothetical protein [Caudoviricetes sp.]